LIDWLCSASPIIDSWLTDWLTDWLTHSLTHSLNNSTAPSSISSRVLYTEPHDQAGIDAVSVPPWDTSFLWRYSCGWHTSWPPSLWGTHLQAGFCMVSLNVWTADELLLYGFSECLDSRWIASVWFYAMFGQPMLMLLYDFMQCLDSRC
jgi:hypothetical protein